MLKQRIITALVLVAILGLSLTIAAPYGFPCFALLMVGVVIFEWLMLLSSPRAGAIAVAVAMMAVLGWIDHSGDAAIVAWSFGIASAIWVLLCAGLFARGTFPSTTRWRPLHVALALLLPAACWFALVAAYRHGLVYLVSILAIVWAADVAAYFAGRAFGKRKLAPSISPGKTWAGAVGGALAAMTVALVCARAGPLSDSFFAVVDRRWSLSGVAIAAVALATLSVVGDLFESYLKRQRGVKDSSRLLPGHGGVFDRVDALLPIVPIALLLQTFA